MATRSVMIPQTCGTDSEARSGWQAFHDALLYCGLVWDTSIPGQLDIPTATKPSTQNTVAGYRWYHFNDAFQTSAPVLLRVGFGTAQDNPNAFSFYVYAGQASGPGVGAWKDNAAVGVLTAAGSPFGTPQNSLFAGDGSRIHIAMWRSPGYAAALGSLERIKDSSGSDTAQGIMFYRNYTNNKFTGSVVFDTTNRAYQSSSAGLLVPPGITTGALGSDKIAWVRRAHGPNALPAMLGTLGYFGADFAMDTPITVQGYDGHNHVYVPLGTNDSLNQAFDGPSPAAGFYNLMRWE